MFLIESPHRGDSNENTQYTIFQNYPKSAAMGFFQGTQERVRTAVVNEPSVFEPLKFYFTYYQKYGTEKLILVIVLRDIVS